MNQNVPLWLRLAGFAAFLLMMAGLWWFLHQLFYDWLPAPIAATLGYLMLVVAAVVVAVTSSARRKRDRRAASGGQKRVIDPLLDGELLVPPRDGIRDRLNRR